MQSRYEIDDEYMDFNGDLLIKFQVSGSPLTPDQCKIRYNGMNVYEGLRDLKVSEVMGKGKRKQEEVTLEWLGQFVIK